MARIDANGPNFEPLAPERARVWPGQIRRVQAWQLHHVVWHRLRMWEGRGSAGLSPAVDEVSAPPDAGLDRVAIGFFVGQDMRGMAELRTLSARWPRKAQVSVSMETHWRGQGIGTALMAEALSLARERGIDRLYLTCHALNRRTQRIAERFGARIGFEGCECSLEFRVESQPHVAA